jgi:hypothetical protein
MARRLGASRSAVPSPCLTGTSPKAGGKRLRKSQQKSRDRYVPALPAPAQRPDDCRYWALPVLYPKTCARRAKATDKDSITHPPPPKRAGKGAVILSPWEFATNRCVPLFPPERDASGKARTGHLCHNVLQNKHLRKLSRWRARKLSRWRARLGPRQGTGRPPPGRCPNQRGRDQRRGRYGRAAGSRRMTDAALFLAPAARRRASAG